MTIRGNWLELVSFHGENRNLASSAAINEGRCHDDNPECQETQRKHF